LDKPTENLTSVKNISYPELFSVSLDLGVGKLKCRPYAHLLLRDTVESASNKSRRLTPNDEDESKD
jgi:hypothetical protein